MAENLSENAVMCNFQCFKRYGFNFAEKDWYFGKYKISYVAFIGIWIIAIKCWLTVYYKGIVTDSWSLTNFTLTFSTGLGAFIYLMKMMSFLWKNKIIYNLADLLKNDLIVIDILDQRLKKDQTFCLKISKLVFRLNCFGLFFQYSSFFYNYDDIPLPIFFFENVLDILCLIIISSFIMNTQTLPITAMVLLRSKLEVLCGEFKNLEYHSEEQFDETITKLVEYHESLLK